jgi:uncharacterized membrane protein YraQ (UPF0718 family)
MDFLFTMLRGGLDALEDYILAHTLTCLVPAFFIAGAMSALFPKDKILKYLGEKTKAYISYPISVVAGLFLAVCSCTVLPLFAGIRQRGGGLGPAVAFLYTAPATNILAIIYTGGLIGADLALARIILSVSFASIIGMILSATFKGEEKKILSNVPNPAISQTLTDRGEKVKSYRFLVFFLILVAILLFGASSLIGWTIKITILSVLISALLAIIIFWMPKEDTQSWLKETFSFAQTIVPLLLVGVFVAGILKVVIPEKFITTYVGGNKISSNLFAVLFGVFMYFPTLVEVPMARTFLDLGMGRGPLLAYLLADPVISFPSILVISKLIGLKRMFVYVGLITFFCTAAGLIYGFFLSLMG